MMSTSRSIRVQGKSHEFEDEWKWPFPLVIQHMQIGRFHREIIFKRWKTIQFRDFRELY
jgi:hypothetical protein